jgi:hypothetical protein
MAGPKGCPNVAALDLRNGLGGGLAPSCFLSSSILMLKEM